MFLRVSNQPFKGLSKAVKRPSKGLYKAFKKPLKAAAAAAATASSYEAKTVEIWIHTPRSSPKKKKAKEALKQN